MSIVKHKELTEHLFRDILKKPMISEYYPECEETRCNTQHNTQHIGKCRRLCYNCSGTKYIAFPIPGLYDIMIHYRIGDAIAQERIPYSARFNVYRSPKDVNTIREALYAWYITVPFPKCDSCKYVEEWKRENWKKRVEKAIRGDAEDSKELRKIFYKKNERVAIRKLLTFFNCVATIRMRDSLSGVIDYMHPARQSPPPTPPPPASP